MLQPSLVILEDVDLVFASREINLYSSVLGYVESRVELRDDDFDYALREMRQSKDASAGRIIGFHS
jgi:hypothetical protein